jgi:hypothetical protein
MSGVATRLASDEAERRPDVSRTPDAQGSAVPTATVTVRSEAGAYTSSPRVLGDGAAFGYASWHQQARRAHLQ